VARFTSERAKFKSIRNESWAIIKKKFTLIVRTKIKANIVIHVQLVKGKDSPQFFILLSHHVNNDKSKIKFISLGYFSLKSTIRKKETQTISNLLHSWIVCVLNEKFMKLRIEGIIIQYVQKFCKLCANFAKFVIKVASALQ
jgi:hypothetical protein